VFGYTTFLNGEGLPTLLDCAFRGRLVVSRRTSNGVDVACGMTVPEDAGWSSKIWMCDRRGRCEVALDIARAI
jgi:hypothetical protein